MNTIMTCPFCSRELTAANAVEGGRYSCPTCAATSKEAEYGWLPRAQAPKIASTTAARSNGLGQHSGSDILGSDAKGRPIARERTCECGRRFTQYQLSASFMRITAGHSERAASLVEKQCPGLFVPVHCPACERVDLRRRAQIDAHTNDYPPPFGERHDAA